MIAVHEFEIQLTQGRGAKAAGIRQPHVHIGTHVKQRIDRRDNGGRIVHGIVAETHARTEIEPCQGFYFH
ncbi:hypothetical protein Barb4_00133 [Bacteroidales bacterium Barb4]|nr:hypothetical protein Barb4_00133 [Bacteroidales bacterium Barb4]